MRKTGCRMIPVCHDTLALFGGYGIPRGDIQAASSFIKDDRFSDGRGWTNEFHIFNVTEGKALPMCHNTI